jgi:hypothetical protein
MEGEIGTRNYFGLQVKCPSLLNDFDQSCTYCTECTASVKSVDLVTPLLCQARKGRKTLPTSIVKRPSLGTDFDQTCPDCGAWSGNARCTASVTPLQCEVREGRNTFGLKSKVPFVTERFQPNVYQLWIVGRECHMCSSSHPAPMRREIRTKTCFCLKTKLPLISDWFRPTLHRL